ncbi:MAG: PfaD family polyunsaturated fatty acid/polyketide biosynthesis protein [Deltaproteobacteria bacterium]|nr:PfaD family polyunsaturated fatty acid/polyketide biosynthesis protein [Deltaproteobacteria bacterium]
MPPPGNDNLARIGQALPPPPATATLEQRSLELLRELDQVLYAVRHEDQVVLSEVPPPMRLLAGMVPAVRPEDLGSPAFRDAHGARYAYASGAMAGGIASVQLVVAVGRAGGIGFFGSGGLPLSGIESAVREVQGTLASEPYGFNLLHNPFEPGLELETVELFLKHQVRRVEAAAFMRITPAVVLYRARGLRALPDGRIAAPNRVLAKVSRPEIAARFMAPPPTALLRELVASGRLHEDEARLAARLPIAEDITAEADSGGPTDQRPLAVLLPLILDERERAMERHGWAHEHLAIRVGAAGGIGDPMAAHAALSLGADYLMTGSINQACVEAGTSAHVKQLLAAADMADVAMAPAPDMFEIGARVQVLKRGTLYPQRAQRLYELFKAYPDFESAPAPEREKVERQILRRPFAEVWADTERYWQARDPAKAEEGRRDGKTRMALCFRWYLGMSSRWAAKDDPERRSDYQVWCGPAIGALNRWTRGTALAQPEARDAATLARALLTGAAALARREAAARAGVKGLPSPFEVARPS